VIGKTSEVNVATGIHEGREPNVQQVERAGCDGKLSHCILIAGVQETL
jgi:hypothetical protein